MKKLITAVITVCFFAALAFAVRFVLMRAQPQISEDGVLYIQIARQLIKGRSFFSFHRPLYPSLIALFSLFFGDWELCGNLVAVFFGALSVVPLFFIARWAFGNKAAIITCLLFILYPKLCEFSSTVVTESVFMFILLLGLMVSWAALSKNRPVFYLVAGFVWGLTFLTRSEGMVYFLFFAFIILIKFLKNLRLKWLFYLVLILTGFLAICGPYLIYGKKEPSHWSFALVLRLGERVGQKDSWADAFDDCVFGLSEDGKKVGYETIAEQDKGVVAYFLSNPRELIRRYIVNLHLVNKYVIPELFYPLIIVLFSAGLFLGDAGKTKRAAVLFLAFIPYAAAPVVPVAERYFLPFVPIILIWASRGILETAKWMMSSMKENSPRRQALVEALIVIVVLSSFVPFTFRPLLRGERGPNIYREIGVWIKANLPEDSILMCRKPWVPFYAGRKQVILPQAHFDKVLQFARDRRADYLIADENITEHLPDFDFIFEENFSSKELKLIHKFKDPTGRRIYIFQILH